MLNRRSAGAAAYLVPTFSGNASRKTSGKTSWVSRPTYNQTLIKVGLVLAAIEAAETGLQLWAAASLL
jgi:hypothetical protein